MSFVRISYGARDKMEEVAKLGRKGERMKKIEAVNCSEEGN